jgi:GT2 family glycosyltransferase
MVSVAVVVVTYNSGATLAACLDALSKQTLQPARTLVIDNASPNGFPSDALADRAAIEVVRNRKNVGFAAANNQAFALLEGEPHCEFVALLNPDAFAEPTWLSEMVDAAAMFPEHDAFASRMMVDGTKDIVDGMGDVYHISGLAWRDGHGLRLLPDHLVGREVFGVCAGAGFYRLSAVKRAGGFDADLFCYMEDVDLSFRMRRLGMRCRYVPSAVVWHVGGESSRDNLKFRLYYGHRNMILVYLKNMPTGLLLATFPIHIAVNLIGIVRSMWRGESSVVLCAKFHAVRFLPDLMRSRKSLEHGACVGSRRLFPLLSRSLRRNISAIESH